MPSPFPGMDPFLEDPELFADFHDSFLAYLREAIQSQLPPPYIAALGRRAWIEVSERFIGPDVQLVHHRRSEPETTPAPNSAVTVVPRMQPIVIRIPHDERSESLIEIYVGRGSDRRLVTSIELLSLTNKSPGEHGRDLYLRKQRELLESKVHLVEIDLLRGGQHTTAVPRQHLTEAVGKFDYHVCVHHFDNLEDFFVYPIQLPDTLPEIAVPLLPGDPAVQVDLQAVFRRTYNAGPYQREIRYQPEVPPPPLRPDLQIWLQELIAGQEQENSPGTG